MQSVLRNMILAMAAIAFAASMSSVAAQSKDPRMGTWNLNVEKSKFSPGPAPKSLTITFEPAGKGVKLTTSGVNADGSPSVTGYTANYDGKDYPLKGSPTADTVSLKQVNSLTTVRSDKKDGKVVTTLKSVVAKNGKAYTVTVKGKTPKGEPVNNTLVFERP
jgi:hypothetical protein